MCVCACQPHTHICVPTYASAVVAYTHALLKCIATRTSPAHCVHVCLHIDSPLCTNVPKRACLRHAPLPQSKACWTPVYVVSCPVVPLNTAYCVHMCHTHTHCYTYACKMLGLRITPSSSHILANVHAHSPIRLRILLPPHSTSMLHGFHSQPCYLII